jgi:uncharacterized protein (DUF2249 family)
VNGEPTILVDNRGLEPPEPMTRILGRLADLPPGGVLLAHNDREPLFLYPILEDEGFAHATEQQADGTYLVRIWRREAS